MKKNLMLSIIGTIIVFITYVSAVPDYSSCQAGYGMMGSLYGSYGSTFMILSWITYVSFIALIIAGIYWLIKSANRRK